MKALPMMDWWPFRSRKEVHITSTDNLPLERSSYQHHWHTRPRWLGSWSRTFLEAFDGAVAVLTARGGVEPQTETVWRQAEKYNVPRVLTSTKWTSQAQISSIHLNDERTRSVNAVAIQLPIGAEDNFQGIVDLLKWMPSSMKMTLAKLLTKSNSGRYAGNCWRISSEDARRNRWVWRWSHDEISWGRRNQLKAAIKAAICKATIACKMTPVTCGTSYRNKGVQPMIDAVIDYMPGTNWYCGYQRRESWRRCRRQSSVKWQRERSLLVFKIMTDPYVGKLAFFRVLRYTVFGIV